MKTGTSASKKSVRALSLAVAAGAAGLAGAPVAEAAPFLTVGLWHRVQGSGDPFSEFVVAFPGDTVEYEIRVQLGAEESVNPYAGTTATANTTTISNWIPSNGSTAPTAGLYQVRFHIVSGGAAYFSSGATPAPGWADAPGNSPGFPNGDRLDGINLIRAAGNFAGIAPDGSPQVLTLATGVYEVAGFSTSLFNPVRPSISGGGFTTSTVIATMRWRNDANTANVIYNTSVLQQTNSTTGTAQGGNVVDPIIVYGVPEPGALGLFA